MFKPEIIDDEEGRTPLSVIGHTPTSLQKLLLSDWLFSFSRPPQACVRLLKLHASRTVS